MVICYIKMMFKMDRERPLGAVGRGPGAGSASVSLRDCQARTVLMLSLNFNAHFMHMQ